MVICWRILINKMKYLFLAMRPYQWSKNLFIFLPVLFGHQLTNLAVILKSGYIFIAFCLTSSAIYLVNDILDVEEDKRHPEKCNRPLASRKITLLQAKITAVILLLVALFFSFLLDSNIGLIISVYIVLNYFYMRFLKHVVIIDVFCVGAFFYLRILAGRLSNNITLSSWIIMCTVLLSLFLAFNKRRYDLEVAKEHKPVFSKYTIYFIDRVVVIISASVIIVYTLYAMDLQTIQKFGTNHLIYSIPFVYYGIFRFLYLIDTKRYGGDPAHILISDYKMQIDLLLWVIVCIGVIYFKL